MAITYEETVQALINEIRRAEMAEAKVKVLEAELKKLNGEKQ
jgi:hypothetical protein